MRFPQISVVIPTRDRLNTLRTCLDSIFTAEYPRNCLEVVVVDDGSSDETPTYLKQMAAGGYPVRTVRHDRRGPARARNRGIAVSSGELVVFTDDDCIVAKDWLSHMATAMEDRTVDALGGQVRTAQDHLIGRFMDHIRALDPALSPTGHPRYLITANACFRRTALEQLGGFNEVFSTAGGEDIELSFRLIQRGGKLKFVPWCRVLHQYEASAIDFLRRFYRYGVGQRHMKHIHPNWDVGYRDADKEILAFLSGNIQLWDADKTANTTEHVWFSLLDALMKLVALAGYRSITTKAQLLESISIADRASWVEETECALNRVKTEIILDNLPLATFVAKQDYSIEQHQAFMSLHDNFQTALQTGDMQRWVNDILQAIDVDFVLGLASNTSVAPK